MLESKKYEKENSKNRIKNISFSRFLFGINIPIGNLCLFVGIFVNLIFSLVTSLLEFIYGFCLNSLSTYNMEDLKLYCLIMSMLGLANFFLCNIVGFLFSSHSNVLTQKYKGEYYSLVLKQDFEWFNKQDLNKLSESIKSDMDKVELGTGRKLLYFFKFIGSVTFMQILFFILSWKLGFIVFSFLILIMLSTSYYQNQTEIISENNKQFNYHQSGFIRELSIKFKTLLCFGNFKHEKDIYKALIKQNYESNTNVGLLKYLVFSSISFFIYIINAIVILVGGYIIKENLEQKLNMDIRGFNSLFNIRSGQILSMLLLVFYLKFYFEEIFVSLKDISETCKGTEHYYSLEDVEMKKIKALETNYIYIDHKEEEKSLNYIQISDGLNKNNNHMGSHIINKNLFPENFKIESINLIDICFDYKNNSNEDNEINNNFQKPEKEDKYNDEIGNVIDANNYEKSNNNKINLKKDINNGNKNNNFNKKIEEGITIEKTELKKEEEKNNLQNNKNNTIIDSPLKKFGFEIDMNKLKVLLSPSKKHKTVSLEPERLDLNEEISKQNEKDNEDLNIRNINNKNIICSPMRKRKKASIALNINAKNSKNDNHKKLEEEHKISVLPEFSSPKKAKEQPYSYNRKKDKDNLGDWKLNSSGKDNKKNDSINLSINNINNNLEDDLDFIVNFDDKFNNKKLEIKNLCLRLEVNKINYLVGKSGSGKTTILSLILNLFKPSSGKLLLNNSYDINKISQNDYLSLIGYVPQESIFFDLSVKENIRFFQENIPDERILEVVKFLKMDKFIDKLKYGIDNKIGPNGSEISGGQRQLISIARALVKQPKILLLDEFTSALDNILTKEIFGILEVIADKTIIIVVTHNLKILDFNNKKNKIISLNKGKAQEIDLDKLRNKVEKKTDKNPNKSLSFSFNSDSEKNSDNQSLSKASELKNNNGRNLFQLKPLSNGSSFALSEARNEAEEEVREKIKVEELKESKELKNSTIDQRLLSIKINYENQDDQEKDNNEKNLLKAVENKTWNNPNGGNDNNIYECINSNERLREQTEIDYKIDNPAYGFNYNNNNNKRQSDSILNANKQTDIVVEKAKNKLDLKNHFFRKFLIKNKKSVIFIALAYVLSSLILVSYGIVFYFLSNKFYSQDPEEVILNAKIYCGIFFAFGVSDTLIQTFQKREIDRISSYLTYYLRKKVFAWFLNLNIAALNDSNKNEIIKLFTDDIVNVSKIFNNYLGLLIEIFFGLISSIIISLVFDWRIGLVCLALIIVQMVLIGVYYFWNSRLKVDPIINDYFAETIANIKLIKAFNLKEKLLNFLIKDEKNRKTVGAAYNHFIHFMSLGFISFTTYSEMALLNYVGGILVIEQKVSTVKSFTGSSSLLFIYLIIVTLIYKYLSDFFFINKSMSKLTQLIGEKYKNISNEETNVFVNILSYEDKQKQYKDPNNKNKNYANEATLCKDIKNTKGGSKIPIKIKNEIKGKIEFKNVSFSYSTEKNKNKVLNNLSFVVQPGFKVGFVGPSGCGKSTILQLLLRFYEPNEGEIYLDGLDIKDFPVNELRDHFSGVFQEPDLFERSIYDNIRYGNLKASQEEIIAAALIAQIPLKLLDDTNKQSIMQISGGQKQRIALARCLMKKRNIYFFDEATSALDIDTEKKINFNLDNYFDNLDESKTILMVAHRLINIQNADVIFVLKDGKLMEEGSHEALLNKNGLYKELWLKEKLQK